MRILIASYRLRLHRDGISHYAITLTNELCRRGHRVWLAASDFATVDQSTVQDAQRTLIPLHQKNLRSVVIALRAIRSLAKNEQIDVVHSQYRWSSFLCRFALLGLPTRLVTTDHNNLKGMRWLSYWGDHTICVSEAGRRHMINYFGISPQKVTVIHNAVVTTPPDPPDVARVKQEFGLSEDNLVMVNVGRLETQKGLTYLLQAMSQLITDYPQLKLIIAGAGQLKSELKQQVDHLGLTDAVFFAGLRSDVPALLGCADLFVLPSLWEGLPFAALEAMSLGVPVIASDVDGLPEIIQHGQTGWLVKAADPVGLAAVISQVLADDATRLSVAEAGRAVVNQEFQLSQMISQTEAIYRQVCAANQDLF